MNTFASNGKILPKDSSEIVANGNVVATIKGLSLNQLTSSKQLSRKSLYAIDAIKAKP